MPSGVNPMPCASVSEWPLTELHAVGCASAVSRVMSRLHPKRRSS
jgi:hypothetical protein